MADISKEIQDFRESVYGEEVRGSLISLAEKVNTESTAAKEAAVNMAGMAAEAVDNANTAVSVANTAIDNARDAAKDIKDAADRGDFTASVRIGTVTTGDAGSEASVSNSGNDKDAVLDITIPRGEQGASFHMAGPWEPEIDYVNDTNQIDIVTYGGSTYGCRKSHTSIASMVPEDDPECWQCIAKKGDPGSVENIGSVNIPFAPIEKRENISQEDTLGVILGKLEKIITDLKSVAFSGKYSDLTGTLENVSDLVNDAGYVTTNTWKANTADSEGYVSAGKENPNKVWGTDEKGNPGWQPAINTDDLKYDTMTGATAEETGTEGMVPAPGAGQQDAFLQGCGIWKNLGAAAFYNVANNDDITEENFLVDGRRFKALRDDVEKINSALSNMGGSGSTIVSLVQKVGNFNLVADTYQSLETYTVPSDGFYYIGYMTTGVVNTNSRIIQRILANDVIVGADDKTLAGNFAGTMSAIVKLNSGNIIRAMMYSSVSYSESTRIYYFNVIKL